MHRGGESPAADRLSTALSHHQMIDLVSPALEVLKNKWRQHLVLWFSGHRGIWTEGGIADLWDGFSTRNVAVALVLSPLCQQSDPSVGIAGRD